MASNLDDLSPEHRKANYEPPALRGLGDVRELTLGATGCHDDSTLGTFQRHPINPC